MDKCLFISLLALSSLIARADALTATNYDAALYGPRAIVDTNIQDMIDSWFKGAATNNLVCVVAFDRPYGKKDAPFFYVNVINTTTNFIHGFLETPFEASADIELVDSKGSFIPKTDNGKIFNAWSDQQIKDWFDNIRRERSKLRVKSGSITDILFPLLYKQVTGEISLPRMFQLKEAGEYQLHMHMEVALTQLNAAKQIELVIFWLPEVVAKVQIRPEDIPLPDMRSNAKTNSLTK